VDALPVRVCDHCHEEYQTAEADEIIRRQLRNDLGLLQPEQIISERERFGLTQRAMSEATQIPFETISRWENGHVIQSRSSDHHIRLYFQRLNEQIALGAAVVCSDQYAATREKPLWAPRDAARANGDELAGISDGPANSQFALAA